MLQEALYEVLQDVRVSYQELQQEQEQAHGMKMEKWSR